MLDSVRARLTLWYSGVLALALVVLSVLAYFVYSHNISQRTDNNLVEFSEAFATTFYAEVPDQSGADGAKSAALQAIAEHRFSDIVFAIADANGKVIASSAGLPPLAGAKKKFPLDLFSSDDF